VQQGIGLGRAQQGNAGAGGQALHKPLPVARGIHQVLDVVQQGLGRVDLQHRLLQRGQLLGRQLGRQLVGVGAVAVVGQQLQLRRTVGIAQADAHQETVQLALGQGVGAQLFLRVLGGNHEKRRGQRVGPAFDGDLFFLHGFEQRTLGLGAGPVDFIGQQHLRKHGAGVEHKAFAAPVVDGHPGQVAGHQVGGELHAGKLQTERMGQGMGQGGFAHARHILDQQVSTGQQAGHAVLDLLFFANDHRVKLIQKRPDFL